MTTKTLSERVAPEALAHTEAEAAKGTPVGPTKMELLQAKRAEARAAKAAAKEARKAELAAKRADGVIGTIKAALEQPQGTTRKEVLETLTQKFPDRDRDGMAVTVGIQFSRLAKSTGKPITSAKVEGRGRVYGFTDTLVLPKVEAVAPTTPVPAGEVEVAPKPVKELHTEAAHKPAKGGKKPKQAHNR